jgi:8-oxo-dGTP diphosphatase
MNPIRTCARAIIVRDGKMLAVKYADPGGEYYALPGGRQRHGESLPETVVRECWEELNVNVTEFDLKFIQEYIGRLGDSSWRDSDVHQIEFLYECKISDAEEPRPGNHRDKDQVDIAWLPIELLASYRFYPRKLLEYVGKPLPAGVEYWGIAEA